MKKGLLSLLAVALTVVGCQNYDDQFEELKGQIEGIETQLEGLPALETRVADIQGTVNALTETLASVASDVEQNGDDITTLTSNVSTLSDDVSDLDGDVSTLSGDVATLTGDVANVSGQVLSNGTNIGLVAGNVNDLVSDMATLTTNVQTIDDEIEGLDTVLDAVNTQVASNSVDIGTLLQQLATVAQNVESIQTSLTQIDTREQLDQISSVLANVEADVDEILNGTTSVNQAIDLTTDAGIQYANGLIATGPTAPSSYIINYGGSGDYGLSVDFSGVTSDTLKQTARDILGKIISVIGDKGSVVVTSTTADNIDISRITYIKQNLDFGNNMPALAANGHKVDGNVTFSSITGSITFRDNIIGGDVTIDETSVGSVTRLDFQNNDITGKFTNAPLKLDIAEYIHVGTAAVTGVIAPMAEDIFLLQTSIGPGSLVVTNTGVSGGEIHLNSSSAVNGNGGSLTIVGSNTIVNADKLQSIGNITTTDVSDLSLAELATVTGTLAIDAAGTGSTVDLTALTSVATNVTHSIGGVDVELDSFVHAGVATLTFPDATDIDFPQLSTTSTITANSATSLEVESIFFDYLSADAAATIDVTEQVTSVVVVGTDFPALTTLDIHAGPETIVQNGTTNVTVEVTGVTTLTSLEVDGKIDSVTVTDVAAIVTNGRITDLVVTGDDVTSLDINHSFIGLDTAPTVDVQDTYIEYIDFSSVEKIKTIYLTGNNALDSLTKPGNVYPLQAATISVTLATNSFTAAYTEGATGTADSETVSGTDAKLPVLAQTSGIRDLLDWYNGAAANSTSGASSISIEIDLVNKYYTRADNTSAPVLTTVASNLAAVYSADTYNVSRTGSKQNSGTTINTTNEIAETKDAIPAN